MVSLPLGVKAGLSLKPAFFEEAQTCQAKGMWWEVHPENYMVEGGPRLAWLQAIRQLHPISLHSVSLSLGSSEPPHVAHLQRLVALAQRIEPWLVSEHLAWSVADGHYHPDLLPVARTAETLNNLVRNIDCVQNALGRRIGLENPSHYIAFGATHTWSEIDFLTELQRRTGCGLLLDVNNVFVSAHNLRFDAGQYIDQFPADAIVEVHLAGHSPDANTESRLLIDSHDQAIKPEVWALYQRLIARTGPIPTLIERDDNLPALAVLMQERQAAQTILDGAAPP